jgi:MFS family permease
MGSSHRWQVMILALLMQALIIGFAIYSFTFFVTPWMDTFAAQRSDLMLAYSLHSVTAAILSPICGILIDRFPARRLILIGASVFCLALVLMARVPSAVALVAVFSVVIPIGLILSGPLMAQTLVAQAFADNQGRALGIAALGTSLGGFVMPLAVTSLLAQYDWRVVFDLMAMATALLIIPLTILILRPTKMEGGAHHDQANAKSTTELLRDPTIFALALSYVIPAALLMALMQNVGPLADDLSISTRQAGLIISITALLMAVGKYVVGSLADRVPLGRIYYSLAIVVGLGMGLASTANTFVPLALAVFLVGGTAGGIFPLIATAVVRRYGPANFGRVMGIAMAIAGASGLAPLAASWGRDMTGSYQAPFMALIPLLLVSAFAFHLFSRGATREPLPATGTPGDPLAESP